MKTTFLPQILVIIFFSSVRLVAHIRSTDKPAIPVKVIGKGQSMLFIPGAYIKDTTLNHVGPYKHPVTRAK